MSWLIRPPVEKERKHKKESPSRTRAYPKEAVTLDTQQTDELYERTVLVLDAKLTFSAGAIALSCLTTEILRQAQDDGLRSRGRTPTPLSPPRRGTCE